MTVGKGIAVCHAYTNYLRAVEKQTSGAAPNELMCMRSIPSDFPELSQPQWHDLDPMKHPDLAIAVANEVHRYWDRNNPPAWLRSAAHRQAALDEVRLRYQYNHDKWYRTEADIDNDGSPEQLVKYRRGRCGAEEAGYAIPIFALSASGKDVDAKKTGQVLRRGGVFESLSESFDLFVFGGKVYVDQWQNEVLRERKPTGERILSVYLNEGTRNRLVCRFTYR